MTSPGWRWRARPRRAGGGDRRLPAPGRRAGGSTLGCDRRACTGRRPGGRGGRRRVPRAPVEQRPPGGAAGGTGRDDRRGLARPAGRSSCRRPGADRSRADRAAAVPGADDGVGGPRARDEQARGEALPSDGPPWVVLVARQGIRRRMGPPARRSARSCGSGSRPAGCRCAGPARASSCGPSRPWSRETRPARGSRGRVAEFLGRTVALSRPFSDPAGRPAGEASARATLEAVERLAEPPLVAQAEQLPAYRLLAALGNLPDDRIQATALLEPLLSGRPATVRERLATLRAVLDHGAGGEAAAVLGIHRNTLAYRVRNLEARTAGTWRIRTSGWPSRSPSGLCNQNNKAGAEDRNPPVSGRHPRLDSSCRTDPRRHRWCREHNQGRSRGPAPVPERGGSIDVGGSRRGSGNDRGRPTPPASASSSSSSRTSWGTSRQSPSRSTGSRIRSGTAPGSTAAPSRDSPGSRSPTSTCSPT